MNFLTKVLQPPLLESDSPSPAPLSPVHAILLLLYLLFMSLLHDFVHTIHSLRFLDFHLLLNVKLLIVPQNMHYILICSKT